MKLKEKKEPILIPKITLYQCVDCNWSGTAKECKIEEEYSEFRGSGVCYPVCPKCGGTVHN